MSLLTVSAFACGILSSITGSSGGIIYAPLLLALNHHPSVSTSTATLFNFFSSLSNTIIVILANQVYYSYAIWLLLWSGIGTLVGLHVIKDLVEKTMKTSIVVFLLVVVLIMATGVTLMSDFGDGSDVVTGTLQWRSYCE